MKFSLLMFFGIISLINFSVADKPCLARKYNHSSIVCVCNENHCDEISKIQILPKKKFVAYYSNQRGLRFYKILGQMTDEITRPNLAESFQDIFRHFTSRRGPDAEILINRKKKFQTIMGFGASFTDSSGINYLSLSKGVRKKLLNSYFGENGLEYNMGRVPIAGTDFSTHTYAYNMEPKDDMHLSNFSLSMEDYEYKIPIIKKAQKIATDEIHLIASSWSPPIWMKDNNRYGGVSKLIPKYYKTWSDYHVRFLKEYDKFNITFWGISTGNEPSMGRTNVVSFNTLGWIPEEQVKWIANFFGPTIRNSKYSNITIIALDDQRYCLPHCIREFADNKKALDYIDGFAIHWYFDEYFSPSLLEITHKMYPTKFMINTESCLGIFPWITEKVKLGSWTGAELYAKTMIQNFNLWYTGWIDWNLVLNRNGGPNWDNNKVDAMVLAIKEKNEFLKQPSYYAMGHFSKFVPRGSIRISAKTIKGNLYHVAFLRPDGGVAVIICNSFDSIKILTIKENGKGVIRLEVPEKSIISVVYYA